MTEPIATGWLSVREAAANSTYSSAYVRLLARDGRIAARKVNRGWLVNYADLMAHKEAMARLGDSKHNPLAPWRDGEGL